jgi:hypothetical protein
VSGVMAPFVVGPQQGHPFVPQEGREPGLHALRLGAFGHGSQGDPQSGGTGRERLLGRRQQVATDPVGHHPDPPGQAGVPVLRVAGEQLVAALPGQDHLHVPAGQLGQSVDSDVGGLGDRSVPVPGQGFPQVDEVLLRHVHLVVRRAEQFAHPARVRQLVVRRAGEPGREGLHGRAPRALCHEPHDQTAVQPSAQVGTDRHVGDHAPVHSGGERGPERGDRLRGVVRSPPCGEGDRPVPTGGVDAVPVDPQRRSRLQLAHALEERPRGRHTAAGQVVADAGEVHPGHVAEAAKERLGLAGEQEDAAVGVVVEREDPEAVSVQPQLVGRLVVQRVGELAHEVPHPRRSVPGVTLTVRSPVRQDRCHVPQDPGLDGSPVEAPHADDAAHAQPRAVRAERTSRDSTDRPAARCHSAVSRRVYSPIS